LRDELPDTVGARRFRTLATLVLGALIPVTSDILIGGATTLMASPHPAWRAVVSTVAIVASCGLLMYVCYRVVRRNVRPPVPVLLAAIACLWVTLLIGH
jgi:uncharacterized BrkB/YihY/UPF0761 family membrane protein